MPALTQMTPLVTVSDIAQSVRFYVETLGFAVGYQVENYACLYRDQVAIRLLLAAEGVDLHGLNKSQSCYIDVDDLNGLYQALRPKLDRLARGRVKKPFEQFYGQREFHVIDEDGFLIMFGEAVEG